MVGAAQIVGVQQINYRFLAYHRRQRPFLEREDYGIAGAKVQVCFIQVFPIRRGECILQTKVFRSESHHRIAELAGGWIVRAVGGLG
jgi:hypothetical protein